jgi:hypothetical protein
MFDDCPDKSNAILAQMTHDQQEPQLHKIKQKHKKKKPMYFFGFKEPVVSVGKISSPTRNTKSPIALSIKSF